MREKIKSVTETTLIPLSLVVVLISGVWVAGHVTFQTDDNTKAIQELRSKQDTISAIQTDIAVMKTQQKTIQDQLDKIEKAVR